jgi:hypothetical protein
MATVVIYQLFVSQKIYWVSSEALDEIADGSMGQSISEIGSPGKKL